VSRCLEKEPERRYQDASELLTALETLPRISPISFARVAALGLVLILLFAGAKYGRPVAHWIYEKISGNHSEPPREHLVETNLTANPDDDPVRAAAVTRDGKYVAYIDNSDKAPTFGGYRSIRHTCRPVGLRMDCICLYSREVVSRDSGSSPPGIPACRKYSTVRR
jgi:hypothetical protein